MSPLASNAMHNALSLPEILSIVFSFLSKGDLVRCSLVCRGWHVLVQAPLWQTVSFDQLAAGVVVDAFPHNAGRVRQLRLGKPGQVRTNGLHCTRLRALAIPADYDGEMAWRDVVSLVQQNKETLLSLEIQQQQWRDAHDWLLQSTLREALQDTPQLQQLSVNVGRNGHLSLQSLIALMLEVCPQLDSLSVISAEECRPPPPPLPLPLPHPAKKGVGGGGGVLLHGNFHKSGATPTTTESLQQSLHARNNNPSQAKPHPLLRELRLWFSRCDDQFAFYAPLLHQCRHLVRIQVPALPLTALPALQQVLKTRTATPFEALDLQQLASSSQWKDPDLASLLWACPRDSLKVLNLSRCRVGSKTLEVVGEHLSGGLEQLEMMHLAYAGAKVAEEMGLWILRLLKTTGQRLERVLIRAPRVRLMADLILGDDERDDGSNSHSHSHSSSSSDSSSNNTLRPWACAQTLRELEVAIGGLCQSKSSWGFTPCESQDHDRICLPKHARVFAQLSTLTRLERLDVTRSVGEAESPDWLEWRKAAGIGQLAKLRCLREVVYPVHTLFSDEDSRLMKTQWPRGCRVLAR